MAELTRSFNDRRLLSKGEWLHARLGKQCRLLISHGLRCSDACDPGSSVMPARRLHSRTRKCIARGNQKICVRDQFLARGRVPEEAKDDGFRARDGWYGHLTMSGTAIFFLLIHELTEAALQILACLNKC